MRAKVVHTSLDCSVLLAGKSHRGHSGNSQSKREHKVALLLVVITGEGDKFIKRAAFISKIRLQST